MGVRTFGPSIGYHGCDKSVADEVLLRGASLLASANDYDWLGHGIYFWLDSAERAFDWARQNSKVRDPAVIGAVINPGHCLNLADFNIVQTVKNSYEVLENAYRKLGAPLPKNSIPDRHGVLLKRTLDCRVIQLMHELRGHAGETPYDSVMGLFEEGDPVFPGAAMKDRSHVQIAVRNRNNILGYFRPS